MGLTVSFDAYSGSCGSFNQWRNKVAVTLGYKLVAQPVPAWMPAREIADLPWETYSEANYLGHWTAPPEDALLYLLVHSDCDGTLQRAYIPQLYLRLEAAHQLLLPLADSDPLRLFGMGVANQTKQFMDGINRALAAGADLEFH